MANQSSELKDFLIAELQDLDKKYQKQFKKDSGNITRNYYRQHSKHSAIDYELNFGSFSEFKKQALNTDQQKKFKRENVERTITDVRNKEQRKYFLTTAVAGQSLNTPFFNSILNFCKVENAKLCILPMKGVLSNDEVYPKELIEHSDHFVTDYQFNTSLRALDMRLAPQHINPLVGLSRFGQKDFSLIVASPKQQMNVVAVSNTKLPHILHSTGAITNSENYTNTRQGALGKQDHILGGLIVEIADQKLFHLRQIQADKNGNFYDLNKYYTQDKIEAAQAEGFVLGDYHAGFQEETAVNAFMECTQLTKPKFIFLHDLFDGFSISHHHVHDIVTQTNRPDYINTLEKELNIVGTELLRWTRKFPETKFVVVRSNHDAHLDKYIFEGRYINDRFNHRLSLQLAMWLLDGYNPIQKYIETNFKIPNLIWLKRDQDFKIGDINLSNHGDGGPDGARATMLNLETSFGNCVIGHTHSPAIYRNVWRAGTTSVLKRDYNKGPSSWLNSSVLVYKTGQRQIVTSIEGKWKL